MNKAILKSFTAVVGALAMHGALALPAHADPNWTAGSAPDALVGGVDGDGTPLQICRANYNGGLHPGKTRADWGSCDVSFGGGEYWLTNYETLVPAWVTTSGGGIPQDSIPVGKESNGNPLFVCRANYGGGVQLGKLAQGYDGCFVPFGGSELHLPNYDVLVNPSRLPLSAIAVSGLPPGQALIGGKDSDGAAEYICLASYQGGLHPGKTRKDWPSCDISWGGGEYWVTTYEVLVPQFTAAPLNAATRPFIGGSQPQPSTALGICNANYAGSQQLGKYFPGVGCFFAYGGSEVMLSSGYQVLSKWASTNPIYYDTHYIKYFDGGSVAGSAALTINYDGTFVFGGHYHNDDYVFGKDGGIAIIVPSATGHPFTFAHSAYMGIGHYPYPQSRDHDFNSPGSDPRLAQDWAYIQGDQITHVTQADTHLDFDSFVDGVIKAGKWIGDAIKVIAEYT
jgi:hypothetical protein